MIEQVLLVALILLCAAFITYETLALRKLTQQLFIIRESDKLVGTLYAKLVDEIVAIDGVKERINNHNSASLVSYTNQIGNIVKANMSVEAKLYSELLKHKLIVKVDPIGGNK